MDSIAKYMISQAAMSTSNAPFTTEYFSKIAYKLRLNKLIKNDSILFFIFFYLETFKIP